MKTSNSTRRVPSIGVRAWRVQRLPARRFLTRVATLAVVCVGATVALAPSALASVTASSISAPANDSRYLYNTQTSATVFTATGTTTGTGDVDIDCFDGDGHTFVLAANVAVSGNSFAAAISVGALLSATLQDNTCMLRAVNAGDGTSYPPGASSPFHGPLIGVGEERLTTNNGQTSNYLYTESGFAGALSFQSAGDGGMTAKLYDPLTFAASPGSFAGTGGLYFPDHKEDGSNYGGGIKVDGVEAFDSDGANENLSGYQGLTVSQSFDPATGELTISERELLLVCEPSASSCSSYSGSGVELVRTWRELMDGQVADQTDVFRSVDGKQHTVTALEDDTINSNVAGSGHTAAFDFPGSSGFQDYGENALVSLPSDPGNVYFKIDHSTPDAGDGINPQGAISYTSAPSGPVDFGWTDELKNNAVPEFVLRYTRTIPAGGQTAIQFSYAQAFSLTTAKSLAQAALARLAPQLAITAPGDGARVAAPGVTLTGTASDSAGIQSLTVQGHGVHVNANGSWSAPVVLSRGANTITAALTGDDSDVSHRQITITYTPSIPDLTLLGSPTVSASTVSFTIACQAAPGTVCRGHANLITVEQLRGTKIVALLASGHGPHRKQVELGSKSFSLAAERAHTVVISLESIVGKLLTRFGHVPASLELSLLNTQPPAKFTQTLTIKPNKRA